jgi:hypothetical protein
MKNPDLFHYSLELTPNGNSPAAARRDNAAQFLDDLRLFDRRYGRPIDIEAVDIFYENH